MRDSMSAATGPVTAASLEPQMAQMSKDPAARHMIAQWSAVSDRTVVARAMYDDLTLDMRADLPKVRTPIVLLYPDYTPVGMPAGMMEKIHAPLYLAAPSVRQQLVSDSAHFIMFDQPKVFADALDAFLAQP